MYIKRKEMFKILDDTMSRPDIKHKGRAIRNAIKRLPEVDVVEVVRCKNCIEFTQTNSCGGLCSLDYHKVDCESYCSDGNRK